MGISVLPYRYRINGVVSTDKTVLQNMETLAGAAQSWINYDVNAGLWSVVINTTGLSQASFNDSNIIGGISVQGTGLRELYNSVRVEFPHVDLNDEPDFVEITIPAEDRNPNEPDNTLNIQFDVINDPVMAEMLGMIELKQSRVDRVITFTTDYSYIGLKAGDLIDVTNSMLGYTNKMFRIINISESDGDTGAINLQIQALEYDANVYSTDDLYRYARSNQNGLTSIGAIDPPTTPVITAREQDARPGVVIDTTVPSGVVDGIEFWFSTDNTNYVLLSTERPAGGGTYAFGDTVSYDYDAFTVTGNVYAKCRAVNSTTSSDYSPVGSLLNFAPVQVTDAIGQNTQILDSGGSALPLLLALPALLKGVDTFLNGNANMTAAINKVSVGSPFIYHINDTNVNTGGGLSPVTTPSTLTFTIPQTGFYTLDAFINFGGANVANIDTFRNIQVTTFTGNVYGAGNAVPGFNPNTSSANVDTYSDLTVQAGGNIAAGNYHLELYYTTNAATNMEWDVRILGPYPNAGNVTI